MGDRFTDLLAQLASEHGCLAREVAALRAEVQALQEGQRLQDAEEGAAGPNNESKPNAHCAGQLALTPLPARSEADGSSTSAGSPRVEAGTRARSDGRRESALVDSRGLGDSRGLSLSSERSRRLDRCIQPSLSRMPSNHPEIVLRPVWAIQEDQEELARADSCPTRRGLSRGSGCSSLLRFEDAVQSEGCLQALVIPPECRRCIFWDVLRLLALSYDVLMMPMIAFLGDEEPEGKKIADLVTTVFWTIDIPVSLLSGFYAEGVLEMRPGKIASRYLRGWFLLDFPLVALDWVATILLASAGEVVDVARMTKVLRVCRALRLFRMLRVLRFPRWADALGDCLRSEASVTAFCIMRSLLFIVVASHFVACGFYAVGGQESPHTWVQSLDDEHRDVAYRYTTALHWAVTQFTPASMEIVPRNTQERVFSVATILAAVVGFSCFLSSITQAMANLQRASMESSRQSSNLRKYITQHRISLELGNRITRFLRKQSAMDRRRVLEDDVHFLKELPESVRCELHREVYAPTLEKHPFFGVALRLEEDFAQELCHGAAAEVSLGRSEELFCPGQEAALMFFTREGGLWEYRRGHRDDSHVRVQGERWLLEVALWTQWETRGCLVAATPCEAVSLCATRFRRIAPRHPSMFASCRKYANDFKAALQADEVAENLAVLELGMKNEDLEEMSRACFSELETRLSCRSLPVSTRSPKGTLRRFFQQDGCALVSPRTKRRLKFLRSISL